MTSHTILLEILKILLVTGFLYLFAILFKRAILIGKVTNELLLANYNIEENYRKKLVKKMVLKFITAATFDHNEMKSVVFKLSVTPEFIRNIKNSKEIDSIE